MADRFLEGRVAVITGAGRGIGRAIALALAGAGARLALVDRTQADITDTSKLVQGAGAQCETFACDVREDVQVQTLASQVMQRFGAVHILVNNAGTAIRKKVHEFTLEEWRLVMETNLTGPWLMCRHLIPHMKGRGYGRIINMTSMMSHVALPERTAYAASKAGLLGFTRALALELASEGITVNGISPGPCATEINKPLLESPRLTEFFLSRIPVGRWGRPEEIAGLAVYLCLEEAAFITGTDLVIDGGWSAQ